MFVPQTAGSVLKKALQNTEENLMGEGKVRYIEQRGRTIESQLVRKDPWEESCEREDCFTCLTGRKGRCQRPNSTYRIDCKACEEKGQKATYFGETARCSYDRGLSLIHI